MKVLLLTPRPLLFRPTLEAAGDTYLATIAEPSLWPDDIDFIISYGYRHIIKEPYLTTYKDRMINIHISILPWNRGADPNFWSWFDNTPKGVSIHLITDQLDGGPVIMQMNVTKWDKNPTLMTTYKFLNQCAIRLFELEWSRFRTRSWFYLPTEGEGSYHKKGEADAFMEQLPLKWDTPVLDIEGLGEAYRNKGANSAN